MTDEGQARFAEGYVRPSVPGVKLPESVAAAMPAAPQLKPLDVAKAAQKKTEIDEKWTKAVLGQ
jgi:putative spermidine/putrescine transport system substrate-binding protein